MSAITIFPLSWPYGLERTLRPINGRRRFRAASTQAEVVDALRELGVVTGQNASDVRLCSNRTSPRLQPADGGAAAWFGWDGAARCVAYDLYRYPEDNFVAIAQLVRACAAEFHRDALAGVRQAFVSYTVAPMPSPVPSTGWRAILGVNGIATQKEISAAFRRRALTVHPDRGGDRRAWDELVAAYDEGRQVGGVHRRTI